MRVRTEAKDLKVGMIAYLPYYGELRRAKITFAEPYTLPSGARNMLVEYRIFDKYMGGYTNRCDMKETSVYEVYRRPARRS